MRREMWYNANHLYKEVREMKRSLSVFLIAALLLGICAVPALAAAPTVRADVPAASAGAAEPASTANPAVGPGTVVAPDAAFSDISGHANEKAILTLASYGVLNGVGKGLFQPDANMTRAQFAKTLVLALGLTPEYHSTFSDVPEKAWYAAYVDTAAAYGLVNGVGAGKFNPTGTITRQDAATTVARAAKLCGLDVTLTADETHAILAAYSDGAQTAAYAAPSLAFCCRSGILDGNVSELQPRKEILRGEVAQMLCNLLTKANLFQ
jgi:hypothetical protein